MSDFLAEIVAGLRCALEPLDNAFANEQQLRDFFAQFGWDVEATPASVATIRSGFALEAVFETALAIATQLEEGGDAATLAPELLDAVVKVIDAIKALSAAPPAGLPAPLDQAAFWAEFPLELADFLLLKHVEANRGPIFGVLLLVGIAEVTLEAPAGPGRIPYRRRAVRWDRLPRVISDPAGLLREVYRWNTGLPFDDARLRDALLDVFHAMRFPARVDELSQTFATRYYAPGNPALDEVRELKIPLISAASADGASHAELGVALVPITPKGDLTAAPVGFALAPIASGDLSGGVAAPSSTVSLAFRGGFHEDGAIVAEIRPSGVEITAAPGATSIDAGVTLAARPPAPWVLLGDATSSRVEVGGFEAGLDVRGQLDSPEVKARFGTGSGADPPKVALVIQMGSADGFLGSVLGTNPIRVEVGGMVIWSSKTGITLEGGGGFEYAFPLHLDLGIAEISQLAVGLHGDDGLQLDVGVDGKFTLGPLAGVVQNVGFRTTLKFAGSDGRLGGLDIGFAFKPPTGVGLSVNAGVVSGGGFLYIDSARGEYAGALQLSFADFLTLTAIGLITTKMPDGSSGFSLLIIITADFGAGIQLGFGFTLLAVGGLLGLNRAMLFKPLMDGIRSDSIESVMFPHDVIANAPRIISDLRAIFPPQQGTFLIGPMAKLGWGEPTLVSLSLGVIIEIPPGDIAILGILKLALPAEELAVLVLQVNFAGALEFDKQRLYFFASLYDSHILFITIEGEMGLLFAYGNDADFVVSVGGFHPQFNPPPLPFPTPKRIQVDIINESFARIHCDGYFAVTTNTVQFGTHSDFFFGFSALSVQGHSGFDALIQFSPFHFTVSISTSFSVQVFGLGVYGIDIDLTLEGPTPWHAHGTASISFLFFSIGIGIDFTWGDSRDTSLPPVAVMPIISGELSKQSNWRAVLPTGSNLLVSLRQLDPAESQFVLHPVGTLQISQRAVPLDLTLDKVGNQKPSDTNRLSLSVTSAALSKTRDLQEPFAPSQFKDFNDGQRLSQPAFQPQDSGIELSGSGHAYASATAITRVVRYDLTIIDTKLRRLKHLFFVYPGGLFTHFLSGASVARCSFSAYRKAQTNPFDGAVSVSAETFSVAYRTNNTAFDTEGASFTSQAAAGDYVTRAIAADPLLDGQLHVLPQFEVAA